MRRIRWLILILTSFMFLSATRPWPAPSSVIAAQGDPSKIQSVFTSQSPTIDGQFEAGEWDAATAEAVTFFMVDVASFESTRAIPADLYVINDQKNLYLGLRIIGVPYDNPGIAGSGFDLVALLLDNNKNGVYDVDEDQKLLFTIQPNIDYAQRGAYIDAHVAPEGEDGTDLHFDGLGRIVHSNVRGIGDYTIEMAVPLNSGDPHDMKTTPEGQVRLNIVFFTQLNAATEAGGLFGLEIQDSTGWGTVQLQPGQAPPDPPFQLAGAIALITSEFGDGRQIYTLNAGGTNPKPRTQGDQVVSAPALSPDRQKLVYTAHQPDHPETQEIYVANTNRGLAQRLTKNDIPETHPVFSASGREIAFIRDGNIWVMSASGGNERQITNLGVDSDPTWTPDGRIVFATARWGGVVEIAVMNADGANVTRITHNEKSSLTPRVSPDGQWITFFRYDGKGPFYNFDVSLYYPWNIYRIRIDGTQEQQLTSDGLVNLFPVFSPDGRGILYQKVLGLAGFYTVLYYLDLQTGESRRVLDPVLSRVEAFDWR